MTVHSHLGTSTAHRPAPGTVRGGGVRHAAVGPGHAAAGWPRSWRNTAWRVLGAPTSEPALTSEWVQQIFGGLEAGARGALRVHRARLCEAQGGLVGHSELHALDMQRLDEGREAFHRASVYLWYVESGALTLKLHGGEAQRFGAGSLLLSDGSQALHSQCTQASLHHLRLPRHRVVEVVGLGAAAGMKAAMCLDHLGMSPLVRTQLQLLQLHGMSMGEQELAETLSLLFGTVNSLLRLALPPQSDPPAQEQGGKLAAVHRFIEKNLHRHDLNAEQIALSVNSSRAQLYRLFEGQPLSVHGTVREARLLKSLEHLRHCGDRALSIGAIAYACGFSDQSVFSKLFKQRFHVTPTELRSGKGLPKGLSL